MKVGEIAAGDLSFGVSGVILSRKSSDTDNEMYSLFPEMRKAGGGRSSGGEADVEESGCRSVASICDRRIGSGALEVSSADLSGRSSSDSGETLDSFSSVTSKEDCREPLMRHTQAERS